MSKKTIWLVTFALSVTLLGLFVLQGFWIRNAIDIKEEQFNHLTNKTLNNVVDQLENQEMVYQIINEADPFKNKKSADDPLSYSYNRLKKTKYSFSEYDLDKEILNVEDLDSIDLNTKFGVWDKNRYVLNGDKKITFFDELKDDFLKNHLESKMQTDLSQKKVFVENIVNKLIQVDIDIEKRLNKENLQKIIRKQFLQNDIDLNFEFAVIKGNGELALKSENYQDSVNRMTYQTKLFPNDVVQKNNYLKVYFKDRKKYIFKSTGTITVVSVFLSLVVLLGFAITTHIMFKQKRLSVIKNDFVNNMTHELKTPISTISLASQMLKDDSIPASSKNLGHISKIVEDETKRLSYQVEKVLKTALFSRGKIKINPKEIDLHNVIDNVVKSFSLQVENNNGKIEKNLDALYSKAYVDEVHFTNIIFNLLDNAIKYSSEQPIIEIKTENVNHAVKISVKDYGIGIKKKDQKKIFEQFYRVHTGNRHDVKGFGLGLNYVKKMVEEHDGTINLKSEYKKGTRFDIVLPLNNKYNGRN